MQTLTFHPGHPHLEEICRKDEPLRKLVESIGEITLTLREDRLHSLLRAIVGQQLSVKAAATIYAKFERAVPDLEPEAILASPEEELRAAGLSKQKIAYVKDLCTRVVQDGLRFERLEEHDNAALLAQLTGVKGVGKWTAEMFLIFSLGRLDVLSLGDVGLQRACKWLYGFAGDGKTCLSSRQDIWAPYATIPSLYLWDAVNRGWVDRFASLEEAAVSAG